VAGNGSLILAAPKDNKQPPFSVAAAAGFIDFNVDEYAAWSALINFLGFTGGTTPGITLALSAVDEFGTLYPLVLSPAFAAITVAGAVVFHVGPGTVNAFCFNKYRLSWVTTGTPTTGTAQICIYGKTYG
jgi:hypothetical protein